MAIQSSQPLGELLVTRGVLTKDQLGIALKEQGRTGKRMGEIMVDLGFCSEDDISQVVANQAGVEMVDLSWIKSSRTSKPWT